MMRMGGRVFSTAGLAVVGIAWATVCGAATPSDADYVDALIEVNRVQAERQAAVDRLEKLRREREAAQADLARRQEEATGAVKKAKQDAAAALEAFLKEPDPGNPEAEQLQGDLREAQRQHNFASADLKQIRARLVDAQSRVAFITVNAGRLKERIAADKAELVKERARLKRIESGDRAELEELAKRALQEKEDVAKILKAFTPVYKAAQQTSRIALGIHLPELYRAKRDIEAVKSSLCGAFTTMAKTYIAKGVQGLEVFLANKGGDYASLISESILSEPKDVEEECGQSIAQTGLEEARQTIRNLASRITSQESEITSEASKLAELNTVISEAGSDIAKSEVVRREAEARVAQINLRLQERAGAWTAAAEERRKQREEKERELRRNGEAADKAYEAAVAPFLAELKFLPSTKEATDQVADLTSEQFKKEQIADSKRDKFLDDLIRNEVERGVKITPSLNGYGIKSICTHLLNETSFSFKELVIDVSFRGRPLPSGVNYTPQMHVGISLSQRINYSEVKYRNGREPNRISFRKINRYGEEIPYLLPGDHTEFTCADIEDLLKGDNLRILEKSGFDGNLTAFGLRVTGFDPYEGSVPETNKQAGNLRPINLMVFYRDRLDQAKNKAAARTKANPGPSGQPAVAGAASGDADAVMDRKQAAGIQTALIQAGYLRGTADGVLGEKSKEAIRKWQTANGHAATGQLTAGQAGALLSTNPP